MKKPQIVPQVQHMTVKDGSYTLPQTVSICFGTLEQPPVFFLENWLNFENVACNADICFVENTALHPQGYTLTVSDGIRIEYAAPCGALYALITLKQLVLGAEEKGVLPTVEIADQPDIENRGVMLDVSRGRVTTLEMLKSIVDRLTMLKYNQLQLYFDAIVFDYPGMEEFTAGKVTYTVEEIKALQSYCKERCIELVPNQNSFGHMAAWLREPTLEHLGVQHCDGKPSGTLNPLDDGSIELMDRIFGSLLPVFDSNYVNIGCDETNEIKKGATREACEKYGIGKVYLDYFLKLYDLVHTKYAHTPMFWDDITMEHPELIEQLPKDIVVLEWGYEANHPYEDHCKKLQENGLRYYVVPGTSSWTGFGGRTTNMLHNLREAGQYARQYGAEGYLLTDWGDGGHPYPLACSLLPFVIGGMYGWHVEDCSLNGEKAVLHDACAFADRYVFETDFPLSDWLFRFGKSHHLEGKRYHNITLAWWLFKLKCEPTRLPLLKTYTELLREELQTAKLGCKDGALLWRELDNACRLLLLIADPANIGEEDRKFIEEYETLWDMRSKHDPVGCGKCVESVEKFAARAREMTENGEPFPQGRTTVDMYYDYSFDYASFDPW